MGDNYFTMSGIKYELCEIDGEIVLCDGTLMELTLEMLPSLAE